MYRKSEINRTCTQISYHWTTYVSPKSKGSISNLYDFVVMKSAASLSTPSWCLSKSLLIWSEKKIIKKNEKNAQEIRKQKSLQSNCLLKLISILQFLSFDWNFMSLTMQNYLKFDWNPFNLVGPHFGIGVLINMLNQSLVKIVHNRMALGKFSTWFDCNPRCPYYMFFQVFFFLSKYFFFLDVFFFNFSGSNRTCCEIVFGQ